MAKKGKLIVLDGSDGVGKATQTKLLLSHLRQEGRSATSFDFPQYERNFFGQFIGACLRGEHGDFLHLDPYLASIPYAVDRFESKMNIQRALAAGKTVILDRYVSANQMHQGGKIKHEKKRREFLCWLDEMEHGVFGLPRPHLIVYLHLPVTLSLRLLRNKDQRAKKKYIQGKRDTVEQDMRYLANAQKSALKIIQERSNWKRINCSSRGEILPREIIHEQVYSVVKKILN